MDEQKVRERLGGLAEEVPPVGSVPPGLIRKARRHAFVVPASAVVTGILVAVVTFSGVRTILRTEPVTPAVPGPDRGDVVSGAEDHLTVVLDRSGEPGEVAAFDPDGEPAGPEVVGVEAATLPLDRAGDGRLALTRLDDRGGLFVLETDGTITTIVPNGSIYGATWSPDGTRLAYAIGAFGDTSIHTVSADGSDDVVLLGSRRPLWNAEPSWSPDGSTIAFLRGDSNGPGCDATCRSVGDRDLELWAMDANGDDVRGLAPGLHARGYDTPAWSPDSSRVVLGGYGPDDQVQVFVVTLDGEVQQLTTDGGRAPAWSPDGDRIAFVTHDGRWRVHIINADGTLEGELITPPVWSFSPLLWDDAPTH